MTSFAKPKYQLNIKICTDNSDVQGFYKKFTNYHLGDSGIDLFNFKPIFVNPFKVETVNFKIRCEMIDMDTNTYSSYYLVPRSSISKTDFQLANSIGIIDAGYRGDLMAKIRCFNNDYPSVLPIGSYFQIVSPDLKPIIVNIVDELSETTRNDGGFGSTNK